MSESVRLEAVLRTDQGQVRDHNEDFVASYEPADPGDESRNGWLYVLADGVGGADAGEIASRYAAERVIHHYLEAQETGERSERLGTAVRQANHDLRELIGSLPGRSRMATTLVAAAVGEDGVTVANVGDSRAYHWRGGVLRQVTRDQSLVAELVEKGAITEEEAANHPRRNVILHSLGSENEPKVDLFPVRVAAGDRLLLCSDGLTRHVSDDEISQHIERLDLVGAAEALVALANQRGGEDNISVVIVRFGEQPGKDGLGAVPAGDLGKARVGRALKYYTLFLCLIEVLLIFYTWFWIVS
jgi:PPM family protein phosphatase